MSVNRRAFLSRSAAIADLLGEVSAASSAWGAETSAHAPGAGNMDEHEFQFPAEVYIGGMLRFFDAQRNRWTTYGLDRDSGAVQRPQTGRFVGGRGEFLGDDAEAGRPTKVRHLCFNVGPTACRWEQAFCVDAGKSWETNWIIDFSRLPTQPRPR